MKNIKRGISIALALTLIIAMLPVQKVEAATTKISKCTITLSQTSYNYTGKACKPTVTVKKGKKKLKKGRDYKVSYADNTNPGTATVKITGTGKYSGVVKKTFKIKNALTVTLSKASYTYSGKANKPTVIVRSGKTKLSNKYYSVSYKNNIKAGTASVVVTGKSKYKGKNAYATFTITAKALSETKINLSNLEYTYDGIQRNQGSQ